MAQDYWPYPWSKLMWHKIKSRSTCKVLNPPWWYGLLNMIGSTYMSSKSWMDRNLRMDEECGGTNPIHGRFHLKCSNKIKKTKLWDLISSQNDSNFWNLIFTGDLLNMWNLIRSWTCLILTWHMVSIYGQIHNLYGLNEVCES